MKEDIILGQGRISMMNRPARPPYHQQHQPCKPAYSILLPPPCRILRLLPNLRMLLGWRPRSPQIWLIRTLLPRYSQGLSQVTGCHQQQSQRQRSIIGRGITSAGKLHRWAWAHSYSSRLWQWRSITMRGGFKTECEPCKVKSFRGAWGWVVFGLSCFYIYIWAAV